MNHFQSEIRSLLEHQPFTKEIIWIFKIHALKRFYSQSSLSFFHIILRF